MADDEKQQNEVDPELTEDLEARDDDAENVTGGLLSNPDSGAQRA